MNDERNKKSIRFELSQIINKISLFLVTVGEKCDSNEWRHWLYVKCDDWQNWVECGVVSTVARSSYPFFRTLKTRKPNPTEQIRLSDFSEIFILIYIHKLNVKLQSVVILKFNWNYISYWILLIQITCIESIFMQFVYYELKISETVHSLKKLT